MCAFQRSSELGVIRRVARLSCKKSVYQSYTDTGQSSDPPGLVGSLQAMSGSDGFPSEPCFGTTGPEVARRIARLSRIDARLMYGPPGHATASPRALRGPVGTQRTPGGPQRHRRTPFNRRLPGLGGPQLLLAQPMLLVFCSNCGQALGWHCANFELTLN